MVREASRREIVRVCRRLYDRGLIAGQDGNVSVRAGRDRILVTPAGMSKAELRTSDVVELRLDGARVRGGVGGCEPSSELLVHLAVYAARPDIRAVVHAHPPVATGFAVAGQALEYDALAELVYNVGRVPIVPYAMPGTRELADRVALGLAGYDAVLLANHGALTTGRSLRLAHQRMESLEHAARILLAARMLGRVTHLRVDEVEALDAARVAALHPPRRRSRR